MVSSDSSDVVLLAHMPLLRIGAETLPFAGGDLWRMPFEAFDQLTVGAFEDHADKYNAAAPVFYRLVIRPELPNLHPEVEATRGSPRIQAKLPGLRWPLLASLGLGFIERFHALAADPAWLALLLEAPASLLPQPRWSVTFAVADEGWCFEAAGARARIASVQGDADLDYLMAPAFCVAPLPDDVIERASRRAERIGAGDLHASLLPAVATLAQCSSPLLRAEDQATLATVGLEALLLPEMDGGLGRMLAQRLSALLAADDAHAHAIASAARALYATRSASVHGEPLAPSALALALQQVGPRLLAAAVNALDARLGSTGDVAPLLRSLDKGAREHRSTPAAGPDPREPPRSPRPGQPLLDARVSMVSIVSNLESAPGEYLMWAPLVGLHCTQAFLLDEGPRPMVMPLTGHEVLLLEERDIARDFAGRVRTIGEHIPALALAVPEDVGERETAVALLERERDLAVTALRLAGFRTFLDPALAGPVVMQGAIRWRQPSVLRQSVWQRLLHTDEEPALEPADAARIRPFWRLLHEYDASGGHADLERALSLYRRSFDRSFTGARDRLAMLFSVIEMLLGRFRPRGDPLPLERLVARLLGSSDPAALWFAAQGRSRRNDLAHGRTAGDTELEMEDALCRIAAAALPRAILAWLAARDGGQRPGSLLVEALASG